MSIIDRTEIEKALWTCTETLASIRETSLNTSEATDVTKAYRALQLAAGNVSGRNHLLSYAGQLGQ